jgi:hypothetical protein
LGTSNWQNISYNIELIRKLDPHSILDIGVGFGRWGILFREFLEVWDGARYDGNWERIIDGVEIFPGYLKEYHKYFYNNIHIGDALDYLQKTDINYDLINCGDVIEHMNKETGLKFIELAMKKATYVLINIPVGRNWPQQGTVENPFEAHRSIWYNNDFTKFKHYKIKSFNDLAGRNFSVVLLSPGKIKYTKKYGRFFGFKNFLKYRLGLRKLIENFESGKSSK